MADQAGPPKKPTRYFFSLSFFFLLVWLFFVSVEFHEAEVGFLLFCV